MLKGVFGALCEWTDQHELFAESLGIAGGELQSALDEGKTALYLMNKLGLDRETATANMQAAQEDVIQQAVDDSGITQEQPLRS